jgi:hypothetical protein
MPTNEGRGRTIFQEIARERDRGAALIAAGFLETKLTGAIKACLRPDGSILNKVFKPTGPLGPFGTKSKLATWCGYTEKRRGMIWNPS